MTKIQNKERLIANGETQLTRKARTIALTSLEHALNAVDPAKLMKSKINLKDSKLCVDKYFFNLDDFKNIHVAGGGKAAGSMAEVLEEVLGSRITEGAVNVPHGDNHRTRTIKLHGAGHPVPDAAGVEGTCRMVEIAEQAGENDLVICLISGGGSSLMPLPKEGVSLEDKRELTAALLKSGAKINEINAVRKHLSAFKGGWLAKKAYPAKVLNLVLSDVVDDRLDVIASGPTTPDPTTFAEARKVLKKYGLWLKASRSVRKVLSDGEKGLVAETPKVGDVAFQRVYSVILGNNRTAATAAFEFLRSQGLKALFLAASLEGEARCVGTAFGAVANEIASFGNPVPKPAGIVAGGETTVAVTGKGMGGRNQELALSVALKLLETEGCAVASFSTDGIDGPTKAAGAIVDGKSLERSARLGMNAEECLRENDSFRFFSKLDDLIVTGQTGTNVNDISVIVVL